jgi:hypothetical protein
VPGGQAAGALMRAVLLGVSILCVLYGARGLLATWYASGPPGPERVAGLISASKVVPEDWRYNVERAEFLASLGRLDSAEAHYRKSIENYAGCAGCWMGLAEVQVARGVDALASIDKAVKFGRSTTSIRMRAATLFARLGLDSRAAAEFSAVLSGNWDARERIYRLLHRLYRVEFLLDEVLEPKQLVLYAFYSLANRPLDEVRVVWERVQEELDVERLASLELGFSRRLRREGFVHEAWQIAFRGDEAFPIAALIDGSFETDTERRIFGWWFVEEDGVSVRAEPCKDCPDGERALHFEFDGRHNPNYRGTAQDIPVKPDTEYVLRAFVKHHEITSPNGPRFTVRGLGHADTAGGGEGCHLYKDSPGWRLSRPWTEVEMKFHVPAECEGIRVMITRKSANQLNRFFGGQLWVDAVTLSEAPPEPVLPEAASAVEVEPVADDEAGLGLAPAEEPAPAPRRRAATGSGTSLDSIRADVFGEPSGQ